MKKAFTRVLACVLCASMLALSSCVGSFSLSNRLLGWNQHISNKFVNELVFFAFWVLPVYEVCCLADVLVLNSIEFWSGSNPLAQGEKYIDGKDGKYLVKADDNGYDIVSCTDGSKVRLDYDEELQQWSYTIGEETATLFRFVDDTHIQLPVGADQWQTFETSQDGLMAYQETIAPCFAAR